MDWKKDGLRRKTIHSVSLLVTLLRVIFGVIRVSCLQYKRLEPGTFLFNFFYFVEKVFMVVWRVSPKDSWSCLVLGVGAQRTYLDVRVNNFAY